MVITMAKNTFMNYVCLRKLQKCGGNRRETCSVQLLQQFIFLKSAQLCVANFVTKSRFCLAVGLDGRLD